ncbi:MAG: lipoprotein-releasing ABC transporter permease subunit [Candidatus Omnitrophica bacterium]|nr:lipoprotein-releasing ABC transporter permease subunit [Candidatus Omnitrophota bacterium]
MRPVTLMSWQLLVSLRYLTSKHKEKFISAISLLSILGVAVGVAALIIVIAVMSGFDEDLKSKIIGTYSHLEIISDYGVSPSKALTDKILNTRNVKAAAYFLNTQALIRYNESVTGVIVKGIEPKDEIRISKLGDYMKRGSLELDGAGIVIGSELADKLDVKVGDFISLISPSSIDLKKIGFPGTFKVEGRNYRVSGIFTSGMYDYDMNLAYVSIPEAQALAGITGNIVSGVAVRIDNSDDADSVKRELQAMLGLQYDVRTWVDMNKNLLIALKLEKTVMFIILILIVTVACFNIASTLIMTVLEKTKDIGILKAIGATNLNVMAIFALQGGFIGILGTALGAGLGVGMCYLLKTYKFITLPKEIYYIDKLPVKIAEGDIQLIVISSILISFIATIYPAYKASKLQPVEALRYE